jgi:hypothetical protein
MNDDEQLTVKQTASNYWVVERDQGVIAGGLTRAAAEAERELMRRLRRRSGELRSSGPPPRRARRAGQHRR